MAASHPLADGAASAIHLSIIPDCNFVRISIFSISEVYLTRQRAFPPAVKMTRSWSSSKALTCSNMPVEIAPEHQYM